MKKWMALTLFAVLMFSVCPAALATYQAGTNEDTLKAYITGGSLGFYESWWDQKGELQKKELSSIPWSEDMGLKRYRVDASYDKDRNRRIGCNSQDLEFSTDLDAVKEFVDLEMKPGWQLCVYERMKKYAGEHLMYNDSKDGEFSKRLFSPSMGADYTFSNANLCRFVIAKGESVWGYERELDTEFHFPESGRMNTVFSNGPKLKSSAYHVQNDVLYDIEYDRLSEEPLELAFDGGAELEVVKMQYEDETIPESLYEVKRENGNLTIIVGRDLLAELELSETAGYHKLTAVYECSADRGNDQARFKLLRSAYADENENGFNLHASAVFVNVVESQQTEEGVAAQSLPSTGDRDNLMLWAGLLALSALGMLVYARKRSA